MKWRGVLFLIVTLAFWAWYLWHHPRQAVPLLVLLTLFEAGRRTIRRIMNKPRSPR